MVGGWSGTLQPMQQKTGSLGPTGQNKTYGTVRLRPSPLNPNRTRAEITLSAPVASTSLHWAVHPGRCGAGSLPLISVDQFPMLEMGSSGRGELTADVPLTLPQSGNYHVNVFWSGGQDLSDVMTCANLRADRA